ncbi:hypothetical protein [Acidovorax sp. Leaf160]|uniref:hypothetical protein n=1 Tax=Acidovorax sp. Leaf160 TaxID=1736280 RepID=UPI000AF1F4E0|nr:hypothetical protein [Acidovorax sp. Leaf160]
MPGPSTSAPAGQGDSVGTEQARALRTKYEKRERQPWREPDTARIPAGTGGE